MKTLLLSAALVGLFAGVAGAQVAPPPPAPPAATVTPPPPPPPGGPEAKAPGPKGGEMDRQKPGRHGPPPPPPSKAAHFRLESPGVRLDVKCADDEPMQACADIALQLLDRAPTLEAPVPQP